MEEFNTNSINYGKLEQIQYAMHHYIIMDFEKYPTNPENIDTLYNIFFVTHKLPKVEECNNGQMLFYCALYYANPSNAWDYINKAKQLGYQQAIDFDPSKLRLGEGRFTPSMQPYVKKMLEERSTAGNANASVKLADFYHSKGDNASSEKYYILASHQDKKKLYNLGGFYVNINKTDNALKCWYEYLDVCEKHEQEYTIKRIGNLHIQMGNKEKAKELYAKHKMYEEIAKLYLEDGYISNGIYYYSHLYDDKNFTYLGYKIKEHRIMDDYLRLKKSEKNIIITAVDDIINRMNVTNIITSYLDILTDEIDSEILKQNQIKISVAYAT